MKSSLNIRDFRDYRAFLQAHFDEVRKRNPKWSLGGWSQKLGLTSKTSLIRILNGERIPGPKMIARLTRYFKFSDEDSEFFRDLVLLFKERKNPRLSDALISKMDGSGKKGQAAVADADLLTELVYDRWFHAPLLVCLSMDDVEQDPRVISKMLYEEASSDEISDAIERMLGAGLLKKRRNGKLEISKSWQALRPVLLKPVTARGREARWKYHQAVLNKTIQQGSEGPDWERTLFSVTALPVREEKVEQAKKLIRDFIENFKMLCFDPSGQAVFQLQIQMLPVAKRLDRREAE